MFGHRFYNETTRRYVAVFGTLFNDIVIYRRDNSDAIVQTIKVPVNYGPIQKFLSKLCLLYTSPSPRDRTRSRMPSSA